MHNNANKGYYYYLHFVSIALHPEDPDLDAVLREQFLELLLSVLHRIVSDVDLVLGPSYSVTFFWCYKYAAQREKNIS